MVCCTADVRCCIAELADIGWRGITAAGAILMTGVWFGPAVAISATGCWWTDDGAVVEVAVVTAAPCRAWERIARCCTGTEGCADVVEDPDVEFDVDAG